MTPEEQLYQTQLEKLKRLKESGKDPFSHTRYERTHTLAELRENFDELCGQVVSVAGRVMALRHHGKISFADLQDGSGRLQLMARADTLGSEAYEDFCEIDVGDIIGVRGMLTKSRSGEISIDIVDFSLLAKALRPIPEKWHGIKDIETRYRYRYLDLIANPSSRNVFITRTKIIRAIREFMDEHGFMEVETPMMRI